MVTPIMTNTSRRLKNVGRWIIGKAAIKVGSHFIYSRSAVISFIQQVRGPETSPPPTSAQSLPSDVAQNHTPTVVRGWGVDGTLSGVLDMFQYFETILPFDLLNEERYILWVVALLEACDVTNNGRHLGRHLGFYQELEIRLKQREMVIAWHE